jgi:hypothetical protein
MTLSGLAQLLALLTVGAATLAAQTNEPLVGPARDIAREVFIDPVVFDPLLTLPLATRPQAAIESHGRDVSGTVHVGVRNGDDSYGLTLGGPISHGTGDAAIVDQRAIRGRTFLGVDLTNVIWRPSARPALQQQLGSAGLLRLSPESREAVARTMTTTDAADVPWVVFINFNYKFNRAEYTYTMSPGASPTSETHLNDIASAMVGAQLLARPRDPGLFVGFSYVYSAVFRDADQEHDAQTAPPVKVRSNLLRVEVRRPLVGARIGLNPSWTYDLNSRVTTVDAAAYVLFASIGRGDSRRWARAYAGVRVGHQSEHGGFATIFAGPIFGRSPRD